MSGNRGNIDARRVSDKKQKRKKNRRALTAADKKKINAIRLDMYIERASTATKAMQQPDIVGEAFERVKASREAILKQIRRLT